MSEHGIRDFHAGAGALAERYEIRFPKGRDHDQDQEWCEVEIDGETRRIRFHDYSEIFALPGLYEQIFYEELECDSPRTVADLLSGHLEARGEDPSQLDVFDVGAGNGMVAEQLQSLGARSIVGIDIIEAAAEAAERDRPGAYDDYFVVDLTNMPAAVSAELEARRFGCLTTVAALGFGDIPPDAFAAAYNLIELGGTIAFTIKEDFIADGDESGFSRLVHRGLEDGKMELCAERRYRHRLSVSGEPLYYRAMICEKLGDLPLA
jgi:predicted TPR repeat methyltransferase